MEFINFKTPKIKGRYITDLWTKFDHLPYSAGVYLITDKASGKKYVGSSMHVRYRAISYMYPNGPDYKKWLFVNLDTRNLEIELLQDCNGMDLYGVRKAEAEWIEKLNTFYPNGLNKATPSKGTAVIDMQGYLKFVDEMKKQGACLQLLAFSKRLDYYLEVAESTPINPKWGYNQFKKKECTI